jgi:hypothetical protein
MFGSYAPHGIVLRDAANFYNLFHTLFFYRYKYTGSGQPF